MKKYLWVVILIALVIVSSGQAQSTATPVNEAFGSLGYSLRIVYGYDPASPNPWKAYSPAAPPYANQLQTVEPLGGYFVYVDRDVDFTVGALSKRLRAGWNLVGWPGVALPLATATPVTTPTPTDPRARITLALPFSEDDTPYSLIPMGETVYHPKPQNPYGHPGIDFQWNHKARILASAGGVVVGIEKDLYWVNTWNVGVRSGRYLNSYTEMESYNPELRVGQEIPAGTFIGYPGHPPDTHEGYRMIHWNFGYYTSDPIFPIYTDRLCPLRYLDAESRSRIESIWAATQWEYKGQFPYICSGDYQGRDE